MEKSFSWKKFDRMATALEALGLIVIVFGPIVGILLLIFGTSIFRLMGVGIILASVLIAMYHISFSLLMNALRILTNQLERCQTIHSSEA